MQIIVLTEKVLRHLAFLTDTNAHGEAYRLGAQVLGLDKLAERFENIERQRQRLGYLSNELDVERRSVRQQLMKHARACMSPADYQRFYLSF